MDEQNDQAVIEIEETETDTDYDYLSILREMQQGLNVEHKSATTPETIDNQTEGLTVEPASEIVASTLLAEDLETNRNFTDATEESEQADYSAEAATQPLPQLPADFNDYPMSSNPAANELTDEVSAKTEDNSTNNSIVPAENSFSSAIVPLEAAGQTDFEEDTDLVEAEYQSFDESFDNFPELSPILFDASEQPEVAEPDFDLETSAELTTEMMPEASPNNISANLSDVGMTMTPEALEDDSLETSDEMPTNLAFGEMFVNNLNDSAAAFAPPVEIEEETEAAFAYSPESFTGEDLPELKVSDEQSEPNFEQSLGDQDSSANLLDKKDETSANDETTDFALPEAMFLAADENDSLPQPLFALSDVDQETANEMIEEPDLSELPGQDSDTEDSGLAVPWFLKAELTAKSSKIAEDDFPEPSLMTEDFSDENAPGAQIALPDEALIAPSLVAENTETLETDYTAEALTISENHFDEFIAPSEAEEMPETAFAEETPEIATPESLADQDVESFYPEDLPENFLATPLENEFASLPETLSGEMPEAPPLLDDSDAKMLEADPDSFDAPPVPALEAVESSFSEQPTGLALTASEQNFAEQNGSQARHSIPHTVSFLKERFVIFKIDDTLYAFPAVNVAEIGQLLPITPLPFVPSWFLGISNLRGNILSVVGLRELWKKSTVSPHKAKILILHSEKQALTVALVVDAVREMRHVTPEEILSDESQSESQLAPYQIGMAEYDGEDLYLLNAENLLETLKKITVNYY